MTPLFTASFGRRHPSHTATTTNNNDSTAQSLPLTHTTMPAVNSPIRSRLGLWTLAALVAVTMVSTVYQSNFHIFDTTATATALDATVPDSSSADDRSAAMHRTLEQEKDMLGNLPMDDDDDDDAVLGFMDPANNTWYETEPADGIDIDPKEELLEDELEKEQDQLEAQEEALESKEDQIIDEIAQVESKEEELEEMGKDVPDSYENLEGDLVDEETQVEDEIQTVEKEIQQVEEEEEQVENQEFELVQEQEEEQAGAGEELDPQSASEVNGKEDIGIGVEPSNHEEEEEESISPEDAAVSVKQEEATQKPSEEPTNAVEVPPTPEPTEDAVEKELDGKANEEETPSTYKPVDDDPIVDEDEELVNEVEEELAKQEKVAKTAGGFGFLLAIAAMIFTAHQMSENPDGIYATYVHSHRSVTTRPNNQISHTPIFFLFVTYFRICRLAITITGVVVKLICMPCRKVIGTGHPHYNGHMPISTTDYGYRGNDAGFELP